MELGADQIPGVGAALGGADLDNDGHESLHRGARFQRGLFRYVVDTFPVFLTAGAILRRRPSAARAVEAFFAVVLGLFALLYFTWNWIG